MVAVVFRILRNEFSKAFFGLFKVARPQSTRRETLESKEIVEDERIAQSFKGLVVLLRLQEDVDLVADDLALCVRSLSILCERRFAILIQNLDALVSISEKMIRDPALYVSREMSREWVMPIQA